MFSILIILPSLPVAVTGAMKTNNQKMKNNAKELTSKPTIMAKYFIYLH
jgi:hypothetical protein